jgi:hypothetical protein
MKKAESLDSPPLTCYSFTEKIYVSLEVKLAS